MNKFIAEHLTADLMKMGPVDGLVEDSAHNWVLAGEGTDAVLIDARAGSSFRLAKWLKRAQYTGLWFDPVSGETRDAGKLQGATGVVIQKPDDKEWMLLLNPAQVEHR